MQQHERSDKIEALLVEMGAHGFYQDLQAEQASGGLAPLVDPETQRTIIDMERIYTNAVKAQDYEMLARLAEDLKEVRQIGIKVSQLRTELRDSVYNEDYKKSVDIKEILARIEGRRDTFDARYETSRYEDMITMPGEPWQEKEQLKQEHAIMKLQHEDRMQRVMRDR